MISRFYRTLGFPFYYSIIAALGISTFFVLQEFTGHIVHQYNFPFSWFALSTKMFIGYLVWALISPVIKGLVDTVRNGKVKRILAVVGLSVIIALFHRVVLILLVNLAFFIKDGLWQDVFHTNNLILLAAGYFSSILQLCIIGGVFFAISYYRGYLEKQEELTNAQLNALKMQLHPHFLFNTLHAISSLMEEDVKGAQKMITQLGDLLRSILEKDKKHTITFSEELTYIKNYLEIERIRFQDRLRIDYNIDQTTLAAEVPTLILQPLVENAIKHGIAKKQDGGDIKITAIMTNGNENERYLEMSVEDNGVGAVMNGKRKRQGVGLRNVRERLYQLYDDDFKFESSNLASGVCGYKAFMRIPYKLS